jgi:hypothetical protein
MKSAKNKKGMHRIASHIAKPLTLSVERDTSRKTSSEIFGGFDTSEGCIVIDEGSLGSDRSRSQPGAGLSSFGFIYIT